MQNEEKPCRAFDDSAAIPLAAFFAADGINPNPESDPRPLLRSAEVIMGVDEDSGHQFLLYGREVLERINRTGKAEDLRLVMIALDQDTLELEKAIALMDVVKGRHDYNARGDEAAV